MRRRFDTTSATPQDLAGVDIETKRPSRTPSIEGDLLVPLGQSLVTALLCGAVGGLVAMLLDFPMSPWRFGAITGGVALVVAWLSLLGATRSLLWEIERISGRDFDGDHHAGPPPPEPAPLRVEVVETVEDVERWRIAKVPVPAGDPAKLQDFARGLLAGRPMSESEWTGSGKPLSQRQFRAIRDELLACGLARWRDPDEPRQGAELTGAGRAVLRRVAQGADPALSWRADT